MNAVLAAGKFDQDTFESILSAIDREVEAEPTHLACHAPYTTAQIFCRTLSESYGQYKPTRVTCDVPPLYARQVLHREFRDLANFVLPILIKNAVEALEASGRRDGQISISLVPEGQEWHVYIKDNGPGLPEDIRNNLFQRGQSSNGEGRGYGLELAHRFIYGTPLFDRASMKLRETSTLGTCFEIILRSPIEIVARGIPEDDFESDE